MKRFGSSVLALAILAVWGASASRACDYGLPWFGYGYSGSLYGLGYLPAPPYFAVHPPVQYSGPVAHAYGESPFARRPSEPPAVAAASRRVVVNPYVSVTTVEKAEAPSAPRVIANPYFPRKP